MNYGVRFRESPAVFLHEPADGPEPGSVYRIAITRQYSAAWKAKNLHEAQKYADRYGGEVVEFIERPDLPAPGLVTMLASKMTPRAPKRATPVVIATGPLAPLEFGA